MSKTKTQRKPKDKGYVTSAADRYFEFTDRGSKSLARPARNGKVSLGNAKQQLAKRDRLRPLVSMIGHCITLARYIDPKGLDAVAEALHKAHSKALDYQYDR